MSKSLLICLSLSLLIYSCSPHTERVGYSLSNKVDTTNCSMKIEYNNYLLKKSNLIGTYIFSGSLFSSNCSKEVFLDSIKKEGCYLGANLVNIYNIEEPSLFNSCYNAYADFYKVNNDSLAIENDQKSSNVIDIKQQIIAKPTGNTGPLQLELLASFGFDFHAGDFGNILNDNSYIHVINSNLPGSALDIGFESNIWFNRFGLNLGYNYLYTSGSYASSSYNSTQSLSICTEGIYKLGVAVKLLSNENPNSNFKTVFLRGGINYSNFSFINKDFFNDVSGSGTGYFIESGLTIQIDNSFIADAIIGYRVTNIELPNSPDKYSLGKIYLGASFGFQLFN